MSVLGVLVSSVGEGKLLGLRFCVSGISGVSALMFSLVSGVMRVGVGVCWGAVVWVWDNGALGCSWIFCICCSIVR